MYIFLLIILGLILRLVNIDKPEGLWNDEYVSWFIASKPFFEGFWQEVMKQCHLPLYYLYLKPFALSNDIGLRLTSVIPSLISIVVMYKVGCFYSNKNGYICASITATLPFLIYYAQEVRFYSLVFLFSALLLYFLLKILHINKGYCGFIITAILLLFTHVLGWIYVGLITLYLWYKKKFLTKKILIYALFFLLLLIPLGVNILKMLPYSQWWGVFSYTNILFLLTDYFSPILTNNVNAPSVFFYNTNYQYLVLMLLPTLIAIYLLFKGALKLKGLSTIFVLVILTTSVLAITGKIVFITKYTIEVLPILILLLSLGIKNKFDTILLFSFMYIQLFSIFTPFYSTKNIRVEGHKLVTDILNNIESDRIIFTYYEPNRFFRYLNSQYTSKLDHISKSNRMEYINNPSRILNNIKKGEQVSVVFLDSVSFIKKDLIEIAQAKDIPEMFITFSIIRNSLEDEVLKNFNNIKYYQNGSWIVINAIKLK